MLHVLDGANNGKKKTNNRLDAEAINTNEHKYT